MISSSAHQCSSKLLFLLILFSFNHPLSLSLLLLSLSFFTPVSMYTFLPLNKIADLLSFSFIEQQKTGNELLQHFTVFMRCYQCGRWSRRHGGKAELHIPSGIVRCPRVCSLFPAARRTKEIFAAKLVSRKSWPELPELTAAWCLLSAAATDSCPLSPPPGSWKFKKIPKQVVKIQRMWFGARFASVRFGSVQCVAVRLACSFFFWFQSQFRFQFLGIA